MTTQASKLRHHIRPAMLLEPYSKRTRQAATGGGAGEGRGGRRDGMRGVSDSRRSRACVHRTPRTLPEGVLAQRALTSLTVESRAAHTENGGGASWVSTKCQTWQRSAEKRGKGGEAEQKGTGVQTQTARQIQTLMWAGLGGCRGREAQRANRPCRLQGGERRPRGWGPAPERVKN